MGRIDYLKGIFGVQTKSDRITAWLANNQPVFTQFGNNIYLSDFVNNAIDRVATEISKINIKSVVDKGDSLIIQNDDITTLPEQANPLQTTRFSIIRRVAQTQEPKCFYLPQYEIVETQRADGSADTRLSIRSIRRLSISASPAGMWESRWILRTAQAGNPYADLVHMKWRRGSNS